MNTNWPIVTIKGVAERIERPETPEPGKIYRQVGVRLWGEGAYEREAIDGIETKYKTLSRVETDDIIVNKIWARNGSVSVITHKLDGCYVSSEFPTFIPDRKKLEPRWFYWLTKTKGFWYQCDIKSRGTSGKNRIRPEKFLEIEIPLPSVDEQRRLVARIEALAAKVERAQSLRRQAAAEVEALIGSAREKLFKLKPGWKEAKIKDFCEQPQYGYTASATPEPIGPKMLRITDIQDGKVNWKSVPFCDCPDPDKYLLEPGDLVFARTGATTGKSFVIRHCPKSVFASYLIRLRVKQDVLVDYLYQYFQSPSYWLQITDKKKGTGQPNVNGKILANLVVPIAPLKEQRGIVTYLDSLQAKVEAVKRHQAATAARLETLLPSVLDRAFRGEL